MEAQIAAERQQAYERVFDLSAGKYDLVVKAGANYSTLREQAREELVQIMSQAPDTTTVLGPMYLRNSDWPGAQEAAQMLEGGGQQVPPEVQQQMQELTKQVQELQEASSQIEQTKAQAELLNAQAALLNAQATMKSAQTDVYETAVNPYGVGG
jgi:lipopolysaccharide biosynthesis regulator YciM